MTGFFQKQDNGRLNYPMTRLHIPLIWDNRARAYVSEQHGALIGFSDSADVSKFLFSHILFAEAYEKYGLGIISVPFPNNNNFGKYAMFCPNYMDMVNAIIRKRNEDMGIYQEEDTEFSSGLHSL